MTQEEHVNMPNGSNVDSQQAHKSSNEITIAPDLNKSISVFNGLATGAQAKD
ncbi:Transposon Ty3-I Gag-Pol polyprotein [Aphis craccivora]|uniref:Transposon Ty3-I Gag-Pol polyprotein n=1 Tax=Aphis craccivora TaxID=307492 RepID=A0A6G0Y923_APHCR|nr:Transposon Ty3-I Gag-Pol polyprotein [Aphis craccivora]